MKGMQNRINSTRRILIGGGSGFVGRALTLALRARGDQVTWISRTAGKDRVTWDEVRKNGLPPCDVLINLAGKHILDMRRRWTAGYRDEVIRSRIETTRLLVESMTTDAIPPELFISTAGKCFYGSQAFKQTEEYFDLDEHSDPVGVDFPSRLVSLWEAAAAGVDTQRTRHVKLRLGIVLGSSDMDAYPQTRLGAYGIFPLLAGLFKRGLCFSLGSGAQPFPWVHVDDAVGIALRAIDDERLEVVYNVVSPGIVSNTEFMRQLAHKLGKRLVGRVPGWLIKMIVGVERSTILLLGQRVKPTRILAAGYPFKIADLDACLTDLLKVEFSTNKSVAHKAADVGANV